LTTTCITVDGFYSDFFENQVGLMQGEVIYTILFAIYVNDCEMEFLNNCCQPVETYLQHQLEHHYKTIFHFLLQFHHF
jgi:hypothetical protein